MILLGIVILLIAAYLFYALVYPEKLYTTRSSTGI